MTTQVPDLSDCERICDAAIKSAARLAYVSQVAAIVALTASIAHEISQPLSGLIANANTCLRMLASSPADVPGAQATIRRTLRDADRASELITRLRATFGGRELTREPFDLNEAVQEVILLSSGDLAQSAIAVGTSLADDLPQIAGDRAQLQLVVINLFRNSSDAMLHVHDRPRELLIKTEREAGNRVRLTVRDTGVELLARAEALFRATDSTEGGDVGIGLFVSRSIIERHQGRLWTELNDGRPGSMSSFSIPSAQGG